MKYEYPPQLLQWLVSKHELQAPPADAGRQYQMEPAATQPQPARLDVRREETPSPALGAAT